MKNIMKCLFAVVIAFAMVLPLVACGSKTGTTEATSEATTEATSAQTTEATTEATPTVVRPDSYERLDEEELYEAIFGDYETYVANAKAAADVDERYVLYAQAEAFLLNAGIMRPYATNGGTYAMSRVAPRNVPYVSWGNDNDRLKGLVVSDEFLTPAERADLLALWAKACAGEGVYDAAAYLISKGHTITTDLKQTFSTAPVTLDWLNTSEASDTEVTVNCVDGLVEYDNLGIMQPALAESWTVSGDGTVYTFKIRQGTYWYTAEGVQYAEVTAHDFEAGFHHMLDTDAGLDWLVDGVIVGVSEYLSGESYEGVGYKAVDDYTLEVTLTEPFSYFLTMLTYSIFMPICESFFLSHGGVYGRDEYAEAYASDAYNFGLATDVSTQVYNGAFLITKLNPNSEIDLVRNAGYWNPASVKINSITWIYDSGENPAQTYKDVCNGVYPGMSLSSATGTLQWAKDDGNFEKYGYISDTDATTFFLQLNVDRGTFGLASGAVSSSKTEDQKIDTQLAMLNVNFRKALLYGINAAGWNAVTRGADVATSSIRNMYTYPEFVVLSKAVTDESGHTFAKGTVYGDLVQYYCDQLGMGIDVHDSVDGWFNVDTAKAYLTKAIAELGDSVTFPINLDIVYYSPSSYQTAQANTFKQLLEEALGSEYVVVNLVEATTAQDYYASGYRASKGVDMNYDIYYSSGWGPDFGDPCTYLDTMLGYGVGYMTKCFGLF